MFVQYKHIPLKTLSYIFLFVQFLHNIYTQSPENPSFLCWIVLEGFQANNTNLQNSCVLSITTLVWFSLHLKYIYIYYILSVVLSLTKSRQNPMNPVDTVTNHTYLSLHRLVNRKFITIHSNKYIHGLTIKSEMKTFICARMHLLKIYATFILLQCCNVENECIILYCTKFLQKHLQFFTFQQMYTGN